MSSVPIYLPAERQDHSTKGVKTMSNEAKTQPVIPEITGITTAFNAVSPVVERLNKAVIAAQSTEKEVHNLTETIAKMPETNAAEKMMKAFVVAQKDTMVAQMADSSRKAVNESVQELYMQLKTVTELSVQLKAKYGKQETTLKARVSRGDGYGNVTDHNKARIEEMLKGRGFVPAFKIGRAHV